MGKIGIIRIASILLGVAIVVSAIGGSIYLYSASKRLQSIQLQPDFSESSLDVGTQYIFSVITTPANAKIKNLKCVVDDPDSSFEIGTDGKIILTTGKKEKSILLFVECDEIKSKPLSYSIIDFGAREQAEADAKAEAEAIQDENSIAESDVANVDSNTAESDESALSKAFVKTIGDNVNIRSENNTESDILGKAKKGDKFEKNDDVDDWTRILYKDGNGYIKSEFLTEITEEEYSSDQNVEKKTETDNSEVTTTPSAEIAEPTTSSPSAPQVINKTFSANLSQFQYNPTYNTYEKNEVLELKVGDTLNYTVSVTNDTGMIFSPLAGNSIGNPMLVMTGDNLQLNPGETLTSNAETVSYNDVHEGKIDLSTNEEHPEIFSIIENVTSQEDLNVLNNYHGKSYRLTIKVKWVK